MNKLILSFMLLKFRVKQRFGIGWRDDRIRFLEDRSRTLADKLHTTLGLNRQLLEKLSNARNGESGTEVGVRH